MLCFDRWGDTTDDADVAIDVENARDDVDVDVDDGNEDDGRASDRRTIVCVSMPVVSET